MNILLTLLILGIIILIHELGHFWAARVFKIPVSEFAIGMGPKLATFHGKTTDYSLRLVPMGGYVNIDGMELDKPVENGFNSKKPWQRLIVLFAGVFMNFLLAFCIVFFSTIGSGEYTATIGKVIEQSKAKEILIEGDKILSIEDETINNWGDLTLFMEKNKKEKISIDILRNGKEEKKEIQLLYDKERDTYLIGIEHSREIEKYTFQEGVKASFVNYGKYFGAVIDGFKMLITGKVKADEMSGPIGLVKVVGEISGNNKARLIWFISFLSINVGIFNLLPFPALDGGRIIFVILEILGIKVSKKLEEKIHFIGIVILLLLFVLITGNDIKKLF